MVCTFLGFIPRPRKFLIVLLVIYHVSDELKSYDVLSIYGSHRKIGSKLEIVAFICDVESRTPTAREQRRQPGRLSLPYTNTGKGGIISSFQSSDSSS